MRKVDYFTLTQLIADDINFYNGEKKINQLGGGTYAVAGQRIWSDNVGFCCCLGKDYDEKYSKWFIDNNIDMPDTRMDKKCIHSTINYFSDTEREEINHKDCGTFAEMLPYFKDIPDIYKNSKGMYFFIDCIEEYWNQAISWFDKYSGISIWEIRANVCENKYVDQIATYLNYVDLFSLNLTEARKITNINDELEIIKYLFDIHAKTIILRMGEKGALVANKKEIYHIPAVKTDVVDVTGGGNSSTGGFLVGYCESNGDIVYAGKAAATSASFIINQYGVPLNLNEIEDEKIKRFNSLEIKKII